MTQLSEVMFHEAPLDPKGSTLIGVRVKPDGKGLTLAADYEKGVVVIERLGAEAVEVPFANVRAMKRAAPAAKK